MFDYAKAIAKFEKMVESHSWDEVVALFDEWGRDKYFKYCQISQERELIAGMLRQVWDTIVSLKENIEEDEWEYISLIKEDYLQILDK